MLEINASIINKNFTYILNCYLLYPCELLINLSAMLFLYDSVSMIIIMMLFRMMSFSIFSPNFSYGL